ncbi:hypothetical protein FB459_1278 [Yimella lutea]|uniref:Uncharacterized protein n=1 Tax=Yimella lutea TaxID=587872 RepID=A0A542EES5_9MICO|nr:hypothetical protein [Yimella lutea]TQJ13843.1 hypothetical protein FB459_1278 [Yimella lutea]
MSRRRAARQPTPRAAYGLPAHLQSGPCIEVWSDEVREPAYQQDATFRPGRRAHRARRAWQEAVDAWAVESGWASKERPASNARNLARTRRPWSKHYLLSSGSDALVEFFEGRSSERPDLGPGWLPLY